VLNGVGANIIMPNEIGMYNGTKELNLYGQDMILPLSGCTAVETTFSAIRNYLILTYEIMISLWPNSFSFYFSSYLCFFN
jgi:hypothetical protein